MRVRVQSFYKLVPLIVASLFILIVAMRLQIEQMFLMAGVLLCIPLVSALIGFWVSRKIQVEREMPPTAVEGSYISSRLKLRNLGPFIGPIITPEENSPQWVRPMPHSLKFIDPDTLQQEFEVLRRGLYRIGPVTIRVTDPLGLVTFQRRIPCYSSLVVHPSPFYGFDGFQGGVSEGYLDYSTRKRGESPDFLSTREYRPGDALYRIHWPSTARLRRYIVVEREEIADKTWVVALDLTRGTEKGTPPHTTLDVACRAISALLEEALRHQSAVALVAEGEQDLSLPLGLGQTHYYRIMEALARARSNCSKPFSRVLQEHLPHIKTGLLLFFSSSPEEEIFEAIAPWLVRERRAIGVLVYKDAVPERMRHFAREAERRGVEILFVATPKEPGGIRPKRPLSHSGVGQSMYRG